MDYVSGYQYVNHCLTCALCFLFLRSSVISLPWRKPSEQHQEYNKGSRRASMIDERSKPSQLELYQRPKDHKSSSMCFFSFSQKTLAFMCIQDVLITGVLLCYFVPQPKRWERIKILSNVYDARRTVQCTANAISNKKIKDCVIK